MGERGCYRQPVDKRPVYAACTQECVPSAFSAFGTTQIKDLPCYQYLGKFNSVPGHHVFSNFYACLGSTDSAEWRRPCHSVRRLVVFRVG